jgi:hypothetical protein
MNLLSVHIKPHKSFEKRLELAEPFNFFWLESNCFGCKHFSLYGHTIEASFGSAYQQTALCVGIIHPAGDRHERPAARAPSTQAREPEPAAETDCKTDGRAGPRQLEFSTALALITNQVSNQ